MSLTGVMNVPLASLQENNEDPKDTEYILTTQEFDMLHAAALNNAEKCIQTQGIFILREFKTIHHHCLQANLQD